MGDEMKKTIRDFELSNKKVLIRVDFNVPMKDGIIQDDNRIKESLKTINYALEKNAKVILLSHLGRVKEESDLKKNDLSSVAIRLEELLHRKVTFVNATRGKEVEEVVNSMQNGDVVLLQNTRYEDLDGKKESSNNEELGAYWASLGDIFINDAFGTSHRAHASNVGIASHLPNGIGFLVEKEVNSLSIAIEKPPHPYTVILGGAKVSDKVGVIESLAAKADYILIGGAMAYTFLNAKEYDIGASYVDLESIDFAKKMLSLYAEKIILPVDSVNAKEIKEDANTTITKIENIESDDIGLDIGPDTVKLFSNYLEKSKLIVWNGTVGYSELEIFSHGTKGLLETLKNLDCTKVIGGGDTAAAVIQFGYKEYMTHISTGGGASLELLEGKELPGIAIIGEHDE
jgi:phosphoglycerate kinase